ncbi:glycosyltransferase family A protein [Aeromonas veronii]|uniref:glycosyltransferase family A protein n=1 Tax=Aeromonas veronii TaxID=654 RepID=UPI00236321FB|nr:glycosyltransferase family A protein [Aeromonas veronii]MDD1846257.1 glycosyltransferase [Aeromonas veronii]
MLLSICIPTTNGRADVLEGTLKSILDANIDPGKNIFEVIVSDNSECEASFNVVQRYISLGLNVKYHKSAEKSFYNSIHSLKLAQGELIKLHNDYSSFNSGELLAMIQFIEAHRNTKEQILFTNGNLQCKGIKHLSTFNDFINTSSYWHTWASGFAMWRDDFEKMDIGKDKLDANFPHVSLLFSNTEKAGFVINNNQIFSGQKVKGKGGYNIFKLFCIDYPDMLMSLVKSRAITQKTYCSILVDMRNHFIPMWLSASVYSRNGFTFDNDDYDKSLRNIYSGFDLFLIKCNAYMRTIVRWFKGKLLRPV